jgi:RNA polymerase sigma-70 factor, ECF subfamily
MPGPLVPADIGAVERQHWLDEFHAGSKSVMTELYVDHFSSVARSVGQVLGGADKETAIQEVFCRILTDAPMRASFRGGSLRAWLSTVARNYAIDFRRRLARERPSGTAAEVRDGDDEAPSFESSFEARDLIARFRDEQLPTKWRAVFDARFMRQLDQSEAARDLGISRTTLLYQEVRIRQLLLKFLLRGENS